MKKDVNNDVFFPVEKIVGFEKVKSIYFSNMGSEYLWEKSTNLKFPYIVDKQTKKMVERCDELQLFVAKPSDTVILRNKIDKDFEAYLMEHGIKMPEIEIIENHNDEQTLTKSIIENENLINKLKLKKTENTFLLPYCVTKEENELAEILNMKIGSGVSTVCEKLNNKAFVRRLTEDKGFDITEGRVCNNIEEMKNAYTELNKKFDTVVLKELHGFSGRGLIIVKHSKEFEILYKMFSRRNRNDDLKQVIVEGWYNADYSLNCQLLIGELVYPYFCSIQLLENGMFKGTLIPADVIIGEDVKNQHIEKIIEIGYELKKLGYHGIVGIDTLTTIEGQTFYVIEINARFNFSTYFYSAYKLLNEPPAAIAKWINLNLNKKLEFKELLDVLGDGQYNEKEKRGYLVMTYNSINANVPKNSEEFKNIPGRFILLIVGKNIDDINKQMKIIDSKINNFNNK